MEDDRRSLELMTLYLRGAAFEVQVARSGEEGLRPGPRAPADRDRPRHHAPAARWLGPPCDSEVGSSHRGHPGRDRLDARRTRRGFALGAADYLVKPVTRDDIVATLSRWTTAPPQTVVALSDDSSVVELLDSVASHARYRLFHAADEDAAVALAERASGRDDHRRAHEGVDAFDVIDRVRADPRTAAVPIVVLTGEAMTSDSKRRLYGQIDRVAKRASSTEARCLG